MGARFRFALCAVRLSGRASRFSSMTIPWEPPFSRMEWSRRGRRANDLRNFLPADVPEQDRADISQSDVEDRYIKRLSTHEDAAELRWQKYLKDMEYL